MAKVLWAADRRVTKDDGTLATSGTLTVRLADTSTTAVAYTDRTLSTEQSVFNIGSDGFLTGRPTIYGSDDVGYDAYVQSTGVNGGAWTIPDLSIAETAVSDVTDSAAAFKNLVSNGSFDLWSATTTWSNISGDNDGDETALGWFFAQPSAASNAVSRQTALRTGARYGLRFGRPAASASTNKLRIWGMLSTEAAIRARGQVVTISFNAHKGADFSGGSLAVKISTGTAAGEDGDNIESGGFTGHATPLNTAQSLDTATARYEFQATIGATVSELGFQFAYTPSGTAGANDWVQVEDVQIEIAGEATAFVSTPEPVSYLIEELSAYGRQLLGLTALSGAVSLSGTTLSVTAANILTQLLTVDGAGSGLDADLLDGTNIGTSGATLGLLNANKTDSGNNTYNGANIFGGSVAIQTTAPLLIFNDTDGGTNEKKWRLIGDGGVFRLQLYLDNDTTFNDAVTFTRTAGSITATAFAVRPTFNGNTALDTANGAQLGAANTFTQSLNVTKAGTASTSIQAGNANNTLILAADNGYSGVIQTANVPMIFYQTYVERMRLNSGDLTMAVDIVLAAVAPSSVYSAGYRGSPIISGNSAYAFPATDAGCTIYHDEAGTRTYTIPANASVPHPIGTIFAISNTGNAGAAGTITLAITSDTLRRADGTAGTGSRTIAASQKVTIQKVASTVWEISGSFS
jgi:hypothetical protein